MATDPPDPMPEDEHLAEQKLVLERLSEALAEAEAALQTDNLAFAAFRAAFLSRLAPLYAELDHVEARIAGLEAARVATTEADRRAAEAVRRSELSRDALRPTGEPQVVSPSNELRGLYRRLARLIHPDLAMTDDDRVRRTRLMAEAIEAYRRGDAGTLRRLLDDEVASPAAIEGDGIGSDLVRVVRQVAGVRRRLQHLGELRAHLESDPLWGLYRQTQSDDGTALSRVEATLRSRITNARTTLAALERATVGAEP